jgi:hypothetical protein
MSDLNCDHCDSEFGSERAKIEHALDSHEDELSSHKRDKLKRRLNKIDDGANERSFGIPVEVAYVVGGLAIVALAVGGMVYGGVLSFDATDTSSPTGRAVDVGPAGTVHQHAPFSVYVNGDEIDFSRPRYQLQSDRVHFEAGDGTKIHKHAKGVTIGYALDTLNMGLNGTCLEVDSREYCEDESSDLSVTVNGEEVENPAQHVIQDGQNIVIRYSSDG